LKGRGETGDDLPERGFRSPNTAFFLRRGKFKSLTSKVFSRKREISRVFGWGLARGKEKEVKGAFANR